MSPIEPVYSIAWPRQRNVVNRLRSIWREGTVRIRELRRSALIAQLHVPLAFARACCRGDAAGLSGSPFRTGGVVCGRVGHINIEDAARDQARQPALRPTDPRLRAPMRARTW